jgi:hypothetical protein
LHTNKPRAIDTDGCGLEIPFSPRNLALRILLRALAVARDATGITQARRLARSTRAPEIRWRGRRHFARTVSAHLVTLRALLPNSLVTPESRSDIRDRCASASTQSRQHAEDRFRIPPPMKPAVAPG